MQSGKGSDMAKKTISINNIIKAASDAYDDGLIEQYWEWKHESHRKSDAPGDTLAKFIAIELEEVYDPDSGRQANLELAVCAIERAELQLMAVKEALKSLLA